MLGWPRAAFTLQTYDTALAQTYRESALQAMAYAEANYVEGSYVGESQHHVKDQRNLAALELYRLTGNSTWHDIFLATTVFQTADAEPFIWERDAAFLYARLGSAESLPVDAQVQLNARNAFLRYADGLVSLTQTTAFG